jgi:hypothetical protein
MLSTQPELIWQGRIHLGDEPGVYGDAFYSGLCAELPITLTTTSAPGQDSTTLVLETEDVRTFSGYPGHLLTATLYEPDPTQPNRWRENVLATERLTSSDNNRKQIDLDLAGRTSPLYISLRVRIDTQVPPGLYDDFVLRRLSNRSTDFRYVASFGFH